MDAGLALSKNGAIRYCSPPDHTLTHTLNYRDGYDWTYMGHLMSDHMQLAQVEAYVKCKLAYLTLLPV